MIENNDRIQGMLSNIMEKTEIIQRDFFINGKTHYNYIIEKLEAAQWDLNVILRMAYNKKEDEYFENLALQQSRKEEKNLDDDKI